MFPEPVGSKMLRRVGLECMIGCAGIAALTALVLAQEPSGGVGVSESSPAGTSAKDRPKPQARAFRRSFPAAGSPNWRETPAADYGLDFVSKRRGAVLIVSTKNEMRYIHRHYAFASVAVRVAPGVEVVRERRELTGNGAPDLR